MVCPEMGIPLLMAGNFVDNKNNIDDS